MVTSEDWDYVVSPYIVNMLPCWPQLIFGDKYLEDDSRSVFPDSKEMCCTGLPPPGLL